MSVRQVRVHGRKCWQGRGRRFVPAPPTISIADSLRILVRMRRMRDGREHHGIPSHRPRDRNGRQRIVPPGAWPTRFTISVMGTPLTDPRRRRGH